MESRINTVALAAIVALIAAIGCSLSDVGVESKAEEIDTALRGSFACIVDEETDADEKSDCLIPYVEDLAMYRDQGLSEHEDSIVRRFFVLLEPGTLFIDIRSGITALRQDLVTGE